MVPIGPYPSPKHLLFAGHYADGHGHGHGRGHGPSHVPGHRILCPHCCSGGGRNGTGFHPGWPDEPLELRHQPGSHATAVERGKTDGTIVY